jgi:hypothetical protein
MRINTSLQKTDKRHPDDDRKDCTHEVIIVTGDGLTRILSNHPRNAAILVDGIRYEHTHNADDGTWVYRNHSR